MVDQNRPKQTKTDDHRNREKNTGGGRQRLAAIERGEEQRYRQIQFAAIRTHSDKQGQRKERVRHKEKETSRNKYRQKPNRNRNREKKHREIETERYKKRR